MILWQDDFFTTFLDRLERIQSQPPLRHDAYVEPREAKVYPSPPRFPDLRKTQFTDDKRPARRCAWR